MLNTTLKDAVIAGEHKLVKLITDATPIEKSQFPELIDTAASYGHKSILKLLLRLKLSNINENRFFEFVHQINENQAANAFELLNKILLPENKHEIYSYVMNQLLDGYSKNEFDIFLYYVTKKSFTHDNISVIEGLAAISMLYQTKKIKTPSTLMTEFSPIVYFSLFKAARPSNIERFIIHGTHWSTGEIRANPSGEIDIFLLDSMPSLTEPRLIRRIRAIFKEVKTNIYCAHTAIQVDGRSCSIFAIDGWKRLEKVGKYLPASAQGDLFNYLKSHIMSTTETPNLTVNKCLLPLYLMKGMQSSRLLTKIVPEREEEQALIINKKGEYPLQAFQKTCIEQNNEVIPPITFRNTKIHNKLISLTSKTLSFIQTNKKELINSAADHTLTGFISRCNKL